MATTANPGQRVPRTLWYRVAGLGTLLLAGVALAHFTPLGGLLSEEGLVALFTQQSYPWWSPVLLIALYATVAPLGLPPGPLMIGGAVFGALYGSIYNVAGLFLGAAISFQAARMLGRDFVIHVTGERMRRAERLFQRRGFWPLVQTRFLPVPFPVVNFGAALAGVRPPLFLTATLVGLIPSTVVHTYFIAELVSSQGRERLITLAAYAAVFVVFNIVIGVPWVRERLQRRKRYREIRALRSARGGPSGSG